MLSREVTAFGLTLIIVYLRFQNENSNADGIFSLIAVCINEYISPYELFIFLNMTSF